MHLPPFLFLPFARVIYKIRGKFDDRNVSPIKGALIAKSPILFIHGDKDTFVPTWMSVQMYEQRKGPKSLYLAKDAKHAMSCVIDRTLYEQKLTEFINQYYVKE